MQIETWEVQKLIRKPFKVICNLNLLLIHFTSEFIVIKYVKAII